MKILVLGSGGREHAIAWKLSQSKKVEQVFVEPGNSGISRSGFPRLLSGNTKANTQELLQAAKASTIELVVIGPEALLAEGVADVFREKGFLVFGPSQSASQLETSKVFAKEFMERAKIPTAPFHVVKTEKDLLSHTYSFPCVLKYDGLAAGKGVVIPNTINEVKDFAKRVLHGREFGPGPHAIVIESFIAGVEISYLGFCDGKTFLPLSSSTDHKRVGENDTGPNTGGMGVISPSPYFSQALEEKIQNQIVAPVLSQIQKEKLDFRGVLYIGLMIDVKGNPHVLEFNTRFGDPETQALLMRWKEDSLPHFIATAKGNLADAGKISWSKDVSIYVVGAAEGYPGKVTSGDVIEGWEEVTTNDTVLFSSAVGVKEGKLVTAGGRVLGIGAKGPDLESARKKAYEALKKIHWRGMHFRKDIGLTKKTS